MPGTWWARPIFRVGSWDRTIVPLPFSRIVFAFGPALFVPPDASAEQLEEARAVLTRRLMAARAEAQAACS